MARVKGFVVTLAEDVDEKRAADMKIALQMVKQVVSVKEVEASPDDQTVEERTKYRLRIKFNEFLNNLR